MIITSWNIRGLNSKGKQRHSTDMLSKEKPQLMLLQEMIFSGRKMEEILNKIKPKYECMTIDAKGGARGIKILWNCAEITTDYSIGMKRILMGKFRLIGNREWFLVLAVYDPPTLAKRGSFLIQLQ